MTAVGQVVDLEFYWKKIILNNIFTTLKEEWSGPLSEIQLVQYVFSNDLLNCDKFTLVTEDNAYAESAETVIEITFDNEYIHTLHDIYKRNTYIDTWSQT